MSTPKISRLTAYTAFMGEHAAVGLTDWLKEHNFFTAPASTQYHGAYEGGLFDHSLKVAQYLVKLTRDNGLKWELSRSPYVTGMFHDLCKYDVYHKLDKPRGGVKYEYIETMKGHGTKSVYVLEKLIELTEQEKLCIRWHMGAFSSPKEWTEYREACVKEPNVLWTHLADMLATREGV